MDKGRFSESITALCVLYEREVTTSLLNLYWIALQHLTLDELETATKRLISTSRFMPKPVEILDAIQGDNDQRAIDAWGDVLKALPLGRMKHVDFEDRLINATIRRLTTWPNLFDLCRSPDEERFFRHSFLKTYASLAASKLTDDDLKPLPGESEGTPIYEIAIDRDGNKRRYMTNRTRPPTPVKIACDDRRRAVSPKRIEAKTQDRIPQLTKKEPNNG